jgi:hypothetical protein
VIITWRGVAALARVEIWCRYRPRVRLRFDEAVSISPVDNFPNHERSQDPH